MLSITDNIEPVGFSQKIHPKINANESKTVDDDEPAASIIIHWR